jgi:hypothetical protein
VKASTKRRLAPAVTLPLFPLPEPPADDVSALLDELRACRRELADAGRIVHMLGVQNGDGPDARDEFSWRRLRIEQTVAERRAELWAAEVRRVEAKGRGLGLDVAATL